MDTSTQQTSIHINIAESNEQAESRVRDIISSRLRLKGNTEDFLKNKLVVKQAGKDVFIVGTSRIVSMFYNGKWEVICNLNVERKSYYFAQASFLAGYREFPSETKPVELYRIQDLDDKGNPLPKATPIDKFSKEYYRAFMDISFYDDKLILETMKKPDAIEEWQPKWPRVYSKMDEQLLFTLIKNKVVQIRDIDSFISHNQITKEVYGRALTILQGQLMETIGDYRLERVGQGVKQEDLDGYLKAGHISKELYEKATTRLKQFHDVQKVIQDKRSEVLDSIKQSIASMKDNMNEAA